MAQLQHESEKVKQLYSHPRLLDVEKEMAGHSKRVEQMKDGEEQAVLRMKFYDFQQLLHCYPVTSCF